MLLPLQPVYSSKHKMSDNEIYARCVGTPQATPPTETVILRIHIQASDNEDA